MFGFKAHGPEFIENSTEGRACGGSKTVYPYIALQLTLTIFSFLFLSFLFRILQSKIHVHQIRDLMPDLARLNFAVNIKHKLRFNNFISSNNTNRDIGCIDENI